MPAPVTVSLSFRARIFCTFSPPGRAWSWVGMSVTTAFHWNAIFGFFKARSCMALEARSGPGGAPA